MESQSTDLVRIGIEGADREPALRALLDWLRHEDELRGQVTLSQAAPQPGEMGALVDVLVVALGSGGAGAVLARSLTTWIRQRRADIRIVITRSDCTVELDAKRIPDPEALVREVGGLLGGQGPQQ